MIPYDQLQRLQPGDKMSMVFHKNPKPSWLAQYGAGGDSGQSAQPTAPAPPSMPTPSAYPQSPVPVMSPTSPMAGGGGTNPMAAELMKRLQVQQ